MSPDENSKNIKISLFDQTKVNKELIKRDIHTDLTGQIEQLYNIVI